MKRTISIILLMLSISLAFGQTQRSRIQMREADKERAVTMNLLGFNYLEGKNGLPKDTAQAINYFIKAAEYGDKHYGTLIYCLIEKNYIDQAIEWIDIALDIADEKDKGALAFISAHHFVGVERLADKLTKYLQLCYTWLIAKSYLDGDGKYPKDLLKSYQWNLRLYKESQKRGDSFYENEAAFFIGTFYKNGNVPGIPKSIKDYLTWMKRSANLGCVRAMEDLGQYYAKTNKEEAIYWLKKAADITYKKERRFNEAALEELEKLGVYYHPDAPNNTASYSSSSSSSSSSSHSSSSSSYSAPQYETRDVWVNCLTCNGTGFCTYCNGRGKKWYGNSFENCVTCHGSGKCQTCYGTRGHYEKQTFQVR